MDILLTLPSSIKWSDYQKELAAAAQGAELHFKVSNFPKHCQRGENAWLIHKGYIQGRMKVVGFNEKDFVCSTTGRRWSGKFIVRSGVFHPIHPIPFKGFQGIRYLTPELEQELGLSQK